MQTNQMSWFDFPTTNTEKAHSFYKSVFAWDFVPMNPEYSLIQVEGSMIGGIRLEESFTPSNSFVPYFTVNSIKEGCERITTSGGELVGEAVQVGEDGYFHHFKDLDGNLMSLWSTSL